MASCIWHLNAFSYNSRESIHFPDASRPHSPNPAIGYSSNNLCRSSSHDVSSPCLETHHGCKPNCGRMTSGYAFQISSTRDQSSGEQPLTTMYDNSLFRTILWRRSGSILQSCRWQWASARGSHAPHFGFSIYFAMMRRYCIFM